MGPQTFDKLRIGDWCVEPAAGRISRGAEVVRLEARTLRLLLALAERPGEAVSIEALLDEVWAGVIVTPDSVYQAVATLRRLLGDDPRRPRYIATVPRLGYRMVARVEPWDESPASMRIRVRVAAACAVISITAAAAVLAIVGGRHGDPASVGVLPFMDLSIGPDQVPLADDITEAVSDRLSHNPRLRTPGFRDAFLLRGKHLSPAEAAKALGVAYVVDGSIRRDGPRVRVAARLARADTGYVIWAQDYDELVVRLPVVEAAIAAKTEKALVGG